MQETHRFGAIVSLVAFCGAALTPFVVEIPKSQSAQVSAPRLIDTVPAAEVVLATPSPSVVVTSSLAPLLLDDHTATSVSSSAKESSTESHPPEISPPLETIVASEEEPVREVVTPLPPPAMMEPTDQNGDTVDKDDQLLADTKVFRAALAQKIHEYTNRERTKRGLPALAYEPTLAENATRYSERMQRESFLDHVDPSGCNMTCRFAKDGYLADYWGENLARWRSSYEPTLEELATYFVREWVKSSGHRDNLLSEDFTHEGIGIAIDGNEVYVTVHFAFPR